MTAEIINLRRAKKAKNLREKEKKAEANRTLFGMTRAERARFHDDKLRRQRNLDGAARENMTEQSSSSGTTDQTDNSDHGEKA